MCYPNIYRHFRNNKNNLVLIAPNQLPLKAYNQNISIHVPIIIIIIKIKLQIIVIMSLNNRNLIIEL